MSGSISFREESEAVKSLKIELEIVNAKNVQLGEENALLRHRLIRQANQQMSTSNGNVENHMKIFSLEEERDKMYENLERLKAKYNKMHSAYLEKVKRCKTLEMVFARQKILPGLVKISSLEPDANDAAIGNSSHQELQDENILNSTKIATLQRSLVEAFDIIDELEFELESVDFLEIENQRLKNELNKIKKKDANSTTMSMTTTMPTTTTDDDQRNEDHRPSTCSAAQCGPDDLPDLESIERSIQSKSLDDTLQAESHLLRRELLRSRLQNTRPPQRAPGLQRASQMQKE